MNKGIIYVMTTVVPGLIKLGKTGSDNFEARMYNLERNIRGFGKVSGKAIVNGRYFVQFTFCSWLGCNR